MADNMVGRSTEEIRRELRARVSLLPPGQLDSRCVELRAILRRRNARNSAGRARYDICRSSGLSRNRDGSWE
jgi:hypothetical protein